VEVGLLDAIDVVLLHSEVKTEGKGHSYLVGLNGTEIGTDEQLGKSPLCALNLPSLLALSCLTASGGDGTPAAPGAPTEAAAEVAKVDPAIQAVGMIDPVDAFTASSSSGSGSAPVVTLPAAPAPITAAAEDTRAAVTPAAAASPPDLPQSPTRPSRLLVPSRLPAVDKTGPGSMPRPVFSRRPPTRRSNSGLGRRPGWARDADRRSVGRRPHAG
jgi:hypothetical protein